MRQRAGEERRDREEGRVGERGTEEGRGRRDL